MAHSGSDNFLCLCTRGDVYTNDMEIDGSNLLRIPLAYLVAVSICSSVISIPSNPHVLLEPLLPV